MRSRVSRDFRGCRGEVLDGVKEVTTGENMVNG